MLPTMPIGSARSRKNITAIMIKQAAMVTPSPLSQPGLNIIKLLRSRNEALCYLSTSVAMICVLGEEGGAMDPGTPSGGHQWPSMTAKRSDVGSGGDLDVPWMNLSSSYPRSW